MGLWRKRWVVLTRAFGMLHEGTRINIGRYRINTLWWGQKGRMTFQPEEYYVALGHGSGEVPGVSSRTSTDSLMWQDYILHEEYTRKGEVRKVGKHLIPEDFSSLVCWAYLRR